MKITIELNEKDLQALARAIFDLDSFIKAKFMVNPPKTEKPST